MRYTGALLGLSSNTQGVGRTKASDDAAAILLYSVISQKEGATKAITFYPGAVEYLLPLAGGYHPGRCQLLV